MKIILHNPGHNGDQLFTLGIVKQLINDNLDKEFIIIPACSTYLFNELLTERVILGEHPVIWDNDKNIFNGKNFISENHHTLWNYHNGDIYINIWKLLVENNYNSISLVNRISFINNTLEEINNKIGIKFFFNCNNYKELIPILPNIDIDFIHEKIISYNKKIIFFYNQSSCSELENSYPENINEIIIKKLIDNYEDHIIILSKPCNIFHKNLINVETEFGNLPSLDAKNLIINANIANLCNEVYFKNNGGSLFILNQINIKNKNNVKYFFIGSNVFYHSISNEYGLNSQLYNENI